MSADTTGHNNLERADGEAARDGRAGERRNRTGRAYFDVGGDEPSPSADMGGVSPGPVPLLRGVSEFSPGAEVGRAGPNSGADEGRSEEGDTSGKGSWWGMCHGMKLASNIAALACTQPEAESAVHICTWTLNRQPSTFQPKPKT